MPAANSSPPSKAVFFDDARLTTKPRSRHSLGLTLAALANVAALLFAIAWIFFDPRGGPGFSGAHLAPDDFATPSTAYHVLGVTINIVALLTLITLGLA